MNPTVKYIIIFVLQYPIYYVLVNGLSVLLGLNVWWCVPIASVIALMYDIGEKFRRGDY